MSRADVMNQKQFLTLPQIKVTTAAGVHFDIGDAP